MRSLWIEASALALCACSKASDPATTTDASRASPQTIATTTEATKQPTTEAWTGHYAASPGTFSVPDSGEWAGVKFRGEDAGVGLGEGALSISVEPGGRISGDVEGPLGPLHATGTLLENAFGAALVSTDPSHGFSGTAVGAKSGERIAGTMRLALPTGNVVREATFTLERKH